jgi:hypothetical protein
MACGVLYIIEKLLEPRCLKWACIAHLDIWNTSYDQKKGRESNCQFDSRPEKVKNQPDLLSYRQCATYCWKALDESYNFALDRTSIWGLFTKLWGSKIAGVSRGRRWWQWSCIFLLCKSNHDFQGCSYFFSQHAQNYDGIKKTMTPRVLTLVPKASKTFDIWWLNFFRFFNQIMYHLKKIQQN